MWSVANKFLNRPSAGFLNCFGSRVGMSVRLCPPPSALITSGVIWCDIGRVQLVKQVSWLFPAFNYSIYFIWHLPSGKWMGVSILTQHVVNTCQRKLRWRITTVATKELPERWSTSFIKVSKQMRSDAFKKRPAFSFTVIIWLKISATIVTFHYYSTGV